jgi:folate-binding protein YgfZ
LKALHENGAVPCSAQSIDWLRILEGTPRYGTDILERDLPQETLQMRALHFSKGCYVGQEIVERIRSRGNVHRKFAAFRLEGSLPSSGTKLLFDSAQVGELTSVASIPCLLSTAGSVKLGLGYLRRGAISLDSKLLYEGGTAMPVLPPISLAEIC